MTPAELAAADQAAARDRDFDRRALPWVLLLLLAFLAAGAYGYAATLGLLPAAPWSPLGRA